MSRLILLAWAVLLASCATPRSGGGIPLPAPQVVACCWQSQERVDVTLDGGTQTLLSAIERRDDQMTVAMLSPLGQPLVLFRHDHAGVQTLNAPQGWNPILNELILAAIYLHHHPDREWRANNTNWTIERDKHSRALHHKGKIVVLIKYPENGTSSQRTVHYPEHAVQLTVTTLNRTSF